MIIMRKVHTDTAPAAIGPYSQGIVAGDFLFTSGQIAIIPETGELIAGGIEAQAEQVMKNLMEIVKAAGSDPSRIVKTTCFLADIGDFAVFNGIYGKYITSAPARSCFAVKALPKGALCEVEAVVYLK